MSPPLPVGFGFRLDPTTRVERSGRTLWGGTGSRLVRLTEDGARELALAQGPLPLSNRGRRLGRRLVAAGLAYPLPPRPSDDSGVTVVIPVRDRAAELDRCLLAVGRRPTIVVDDGSLEPERIRDVCDRHGVKLIRRPSNAGPAAARNTGLAAVTTPFVAFLDSDCVPPEGWIAALVGHLEDPLVCAVAPRIQPLPSVGAEARTWTIERYLERRCPLVLGDRAAEVRPLSPVPYVPTAALLVRRSALGDGLDEALRTGEDVDLIWRLRDGGHVVRYDPSVVVHHAEPATWRGVFARRFRYGTSAGPLARRHPGCLPPVLAPPLPILIVLAALLGHYVVAAAMAAGGTAALAWKLQRHTVPASRAPGLVLQSVYRFCRDTLQWAVMLLSPLLLLAIATSSHPWAVAALSVTPYLIEWFERRPRLDPLRWIGARIVDDIAYGAGVWTGCFRSRSLEPLLPRIAWAGFRRPDRHRPRDPLP